MRAGVTSATFPQAGARLHGLGPAALVGAELILIRVWSYGRYVAIGTPEGGERDSWLLLAHTATLSSLLLWEHDRSADIRDHHDHVGGRADQPRTPRTPRTRSHHPMSHRSTSCDRAADSHADPRASLALPVKHLAVIMDGNGRWAAARGRPRHHGHLVGARRAAELIEAAPSMGLEHLTLYAFSSENWRRPSGEVSVLMRLFEKELRRRRDRLVRLGVRVSFIGRRDRLPATVLRAMTDVERASAACSRLRLQVAIDYGGRDEIVRAVGRIMQDVAIGALAPEAVDMATVEARLDTADAPPPEIVLRTGGEERLSNFLMWQSADALFATTETPWPDCRAETVAGAIAEALTLSPRASPGARRAPASKRHVAVD